MTRERFEELVLELREKSFDTLTTKNARYGNEDALHNFRRGAQIMGTTEGMAALGYMTKHIAALTDMVTNNFFPDRDDLLEKCQDIINYICFIWCIGNEWYEDYDAEMRTSLAEARAFFEAQCEVTDE